MRKKYKRIIIIKNLKTKRKNKYPSHIKLFQNRRKIFITFFLLILLLLFKIKQYFYINIINNDNILIEDNFFIIDSNNLDTIKSHLYGFSITKTGILTDKYYQKLGKYEDPSPQGCFILIRKFSNEIKINQDYFGSFGLYFYENIIKNYFALSNSFLLLEKHLKGKQNITFNKDYADNFIISGLCSPSINETLIEEIKKLPSNVEIIINIRENILRMNYIDYKENTIPLDSEQGLKKIDDWVDKWGYIFRSLKKQTDNFAFDLTGGFDTRLVFSILLSSGLDIKNIHIKPPDEKSADYIEDFKIVSNMTSKFGFKFNIYHLDNQTTNFSLNDSLFSSMYPKLGIHKEFNLQKKFYKKPRFIISGSGGENIRGYPGYPIEVYFENILYQTKIIKNHENEFFNSTYWLCNRSIEYLKSLKKYNNNYEIAADFYEKGRSRSHFGTEVVEKFLSNVYLIQPLIDPDIKQIKFDISGKYPHDLIAFIYYRYAKDLIYFQIQGNRYINPESIRKAEELNNKIEVYKIKKNLNKKFYIDINRKYPDKITYENKTAEDYIKELFKSDVFIKNINKVYDNNVYNWVKEYSTNSINSPLRLVNGLIAIFTTLHYLSYIGNYTNIKNIN